MKYVFYARGHHNVTATHKSTFQITRDREIGKTGDCIIGVSSKASLDRFPSQLRNVIKDENTIIKVRLETGNGKDEIKGYGHPLLTLNHPSDMVCRTSDFKCERTLMIKADKAAADLERSLVEDLKKGGLIKISIIV